MRILYLIFFIIFSVPVSYAAATYANAERYDVTIQKIQVCESATIVSESSFSVSGCVTLGSSELTVDIASTGVGASLGKYADTTAMIQGRTYKYFVPTLSRSFIIKGGGSFTKESDSSTGTCNTDEDASIASNSRHLTLSAGKVGGTATAMVGYVPSPTSSGVMCRNQDCSDSTGSRTFTQDIPDDTSLYGNAISVPADSTATMSLIYTFTSPHTVGENVPVINMQFGTSSALEIWPSQDDEDNDTCSINAYFPKFKVTVVSP